MIVYLKNTPPEVELLVPACWRLGRGDLDLDVEDLPQQLEVAGAHDHLQAIEELLLLDGQGLDDLPRFVAEHGRVAFEEVTDLFVREVAKDEADVRSLLGDDVHLVSVHERLRLGWLGRELTVKIIA